MTTYSLPAAAPVQQSERIAIIDSLRGIALLGILLMNIPYFAIPDPAADNPNVLHELGTFNLKVFYVVVTFLEGSQRAIFSMLFGAGVILFISRLEKRMDGMAPAEYFIRRQLWLLVFGLFDAFVLLWSGDILFEYAIAGIIVFAFRRLKPKYLLIAAAASLVLMTVRENRNFYQRKEVIRKGEKVAGLDTTKVKLTEDQQDDLAAMTAMKKKDDSASMQKEMEKNLKDMRGDYSRLYKNVSALSTRFELKFSYYGVWDVLLFMFMGMAFFKSGVLTGNVPVRVYWWLFVIGISLGFYLSYVRMEPALRYHFNYYEYSKNVLFSDYEIARMFRSLGIFGFIMLLYKSGWFKWLFGLTRPVGQMAFTNYLMQSVLCGLYFYGIGFGMYGKLERYQIYYVVFSIWIIEIIWSHIWLHYFRFGPLEWLWRSLTYWKRQPLLREN
jgi:uncharacterized protein